MCVILDDKARCELNRFNLDIYNNIEEIIELLLAGFSVLEHNDVFVSLCGKNCFSLFCNSGKKIQMSLNYGNEFFNDSILLMDDEKEMNYEFNYDKSNNIFSLKLLGLVLKNNIFLKNEIFFNEYGQHLNVYWLDRIFSFDIQGHAFNFNFYKFVDFLGNLKTFDLDTVLEGLNLCIDIVFVEQILVDEYCKNRVVKSMVIAKNGVARNRNLVKFRKRK